MRFHCTTAAGRAHEAFAAAGVGGGLARRGFDVQLLDGRNEKDVNDHIHIDQLEVFARIGVPEEERSSPQRLIFNITFWPAHNAPELEDEIAHAVDYAAVCAETKSFVAARADRLIETLADALARHLLAVFEMRSVTIELRKFILPEVGFVSVTVTRDRPAQ